MVSWAFQASIRAGKVGPHWPGRSFGISTKLQKPAQETQKDVNHLTKGCDDDDDDDDDDDTAAAVGAVSSPNRSYLARNWLAKHRSSYKTVR